MGDSGEGLIDADSRYRSEWTNWRASARSVATSRSPIRKLRASSSHFAWLDTALQRQFEQSTHDRRRAQLTQAMAELDKRLADLQKKAQ
jgi:hypothetical protein